MARLKKGDTVVAISGKDRGKRGKVLSVFPRQQTALVERLNLLKHFDRRTQANQTGGILEREAPIALAKLAMVCPRCNRASRVGFLVTREGQPNATAELIKQRICKRCREALGSVR